ncbi:hypothetical protein [Pseudomonas sp. Marseille-Q0931]|uniref:hypothetical protein n=1 Tax=Pseudomonas sp. Marseille-Q0931 TaxID=2697507 RepID=UPI0023B93C9E|nr:hypothetical protein [Pseudomonas sp. Marseille-Q0931]
MKEWLVIYRKVDGSEGWVVINTASIPKLKAVAWHAIMKAYDQNPPHLLGNLSTERWLEKCGIELVDLQLIRRKKTTM